MALNFETITVGRLTLFAELVPPLARIFPSNDDPGTASFWITAEEWQSLLALSDLQRAHALQNIRLRDALREALAMVRDGHATERLAVLQDFLDGKREGL